jgi:16S rRNA processing protein RimM
MPERPSPDGFDGAGELVLVGRIARTHGIRGDVIVNPETDSPEERFVEGRVLRLEMPGRSEPVTIASVKFHQGRPIIGIAGVDTMEAAEAIQGAELRIPEAELPALPAGTYYRHDLVGCEVRDTAGQAIGRVTSVDGPMEQSRLVIAGPRGEVMVPMVGGICVSVDPAARVIVVDPPAGLVDVNTRTSGSE